MACCFLNWVIIVLIQNKMNEFVKIPTEASIFQHTDWKALNSNWSSLESSVSEAFFLLYFMNRYNNIFTAA